MQMQKICIPEVNNGVCADLAINLAFVRAHARTTGRLICWFIFVANVLDKTEAVVANIVYLNSVSLFWIMPFFVAELLWREFQQYPTWVLHIYSFSVQLFPMTDGAKNRTMSPSWSRGTTYGAWNFPKNWRRKCICCTSAPPLLWRSLALVVACSEPTKMERVYTFWQLQ